MSIKENIEKILKELPSGVELVAAAKGRTADEINEVLSAGVKIIGENYLQEAEEAYEVIGNRAQWHFIGHLQSNKVKKVITFFNMIQTVDSQGIAEAIDRACVAYNKAMQVLVEINSAREPQKSGIFPTEAEAFIRRIACLDNIRVAGLMTMGPASEDPEDLRPYFRETKKIFDQIKPLDLKRVNMQYLSMGMTDSYRVAIEEGANMIRVGSKIFGERQIR